MPKDRFALSQMKFDEISLVPAGDNHGAEVVLSKAKDDGNENEANEGLMNRFIKFLKGEGVDLSKIDDAGEDDPAGAGGDTIDPDPNQTPGGEANVPKTKDDILKGLPDEVRKDVEDLIAKEREEAEDELTEALEDFSDDEPNGDEGSDDDDDVTKGKMPAVLAKADPEVQEFFKGLMDRVEKAEGDVETEREARLDREMLAKANDLKNIAGTPQEKAALLKDAYAVSDDHGKAIEKSLKEANAALEEAGVFGELGKNAAGDTTVNGAIEKAAKALQAADPDLSYEEAYAKALDNDPSLYDEATKE